MFASVFQKEAIELTRNNNPLPLFCPHQKYVKEWRQRAPQRVYQVYTKNMMYIYIIVLTMMVIIVINLTRLQATKMTTLTLMIYNAIVSLSPTYLNVT